jgi:hypothetical protein
MQGELLSCPACDAFLKVPLIIAPRPMQEIARRDHAAERRSRRRRALIVAAAIGLAVLAGVAFGVLGMRD